MNRSALAWSGPQRVVVATPDDPLRLRSGAELAHVEVAYETFGEPTPDADNVVVVCHALTGDAHVAGEGGWWSNLVGPGLALDTDRWFVVCANLLGGCRGTTGPSSLDPATGRAYGLDFPLIEVADQVSVHRRLLDRLGIGRLHAAVGGSLGGMQVLEWLLAEPERIDHAVLVATPGRLTTENIAFSAVAREAIMGDPDFHDGRYAEHGVVPRRGLKVARMMAHITYVSGEALERKFGHRRVPAGPDGEPGTPTLGVDFEVESYLQHQGESFLERFDALSYLYLSRALDHFDPLGRPETPERLARLAAHGTRVQITSFDTDWRFATAQSTPVAQALARAGVPVDAAELRSPWGHDSFLLDPPGYHDRVRAALDGVPAVNNR